MAVHGAIRESQPDGAQGHLTFTLSFLEVLYWQAGHLPQAPVFERAILSLQFCFGGL